MQSGTTRVRSGRRRSSALSNRSADSFTDLNKSGNNAVNKFYDRNLGKKYERFK